MNAYRSPYAPHPHVRPPIAPLLYATVGQGPAAEAPAQTNVIVQDDPIGFLRGLPTILVAGIVAGAAFAIGSGLAQRYVWKK